MRLVNTPELEECAARVSSGVARGVAGVASAAMGGGDENGAETDAGPSALERAVDKLLDPRNWGVVSVVVGGATRQTLETVIDVWRESRRGTDDTTDGSRTGDSPSALESALERALKLAASDDGKSVLLDVCSTFVSQMVGTYLDKTAGSNTFDDFFAAALAASNREAFGDIAGRVTGEAVRTAVEAVSPAAAVASRRAQQRAAREDSRDGRHEGNAPRAENEPVSRRADVRVSGTGTATSGAARGARGLFPDSPRDVIAGLPDASPPSSSASAEGTRLSPSEDGRASGDEPAASSRRRFGSRGGRSRGSPESAAEAAAAFTSALVNDAAPRVFAAFASPDGRRLAADVAGTCAASATRSLVLSVRDAVFFVDSRGSRRDHSESKRDAFKAKAADAARVALAALFLLWIVASLTASLVSVARFLGWNTVRYPAELQELTPDAVAAATRGVERGWWRSATS